MKTERRTSAALLERIAAYSTPELCDGMKPFKAMHYEIKPWVGEKIVGPAFTVHVPMGSSDLVAQAIQQAEAGDILVLAGQGNYYGSLWGDYKSLCASRRGLGGVVIDGAFRDLSGCREVGFPIFARAVVCGAVKKTEYGTINVTVNCGGTSVSPGDIIVGDENGVCVIPRQLAEEVLSRAKLQREKQHPSARPLELYAGPSGEIENGKGEGIL